LSDYEVSLKKFWQENVKQDYDHVLIVLFFVVGLFYFSKNWMFENISIQDWQHFHIALFANY
jgi:hypothetical protein